MFLFLLDQWIIMQIWEIAIIISTIGAFGMGFLMLSARYNLFKRKNEDVSSLDKLKLLHQEEIKAITDTKNVEIANLQKQNAVLTTQKQRANEKYTKLSEQLEQEKEEQLKLNESQESSVEYLQTHFDIDPIKSIDYVKSLGMNPEALSNPALQPLIWEKLNENRDLATIMGILVPKGTITPDVQAKALEMITPGKGVVEVESDPIEAAFKELKEKGQTF